MSDSFLLEATSPPGLEWLWQNIVNEHYCKRVAISSSSISTDNLHDSIVLAKYFAVTMLLEIYVNFCKSLSKAACIMFVLK